jgi:hypothetical protein
VGPGFDASDLKRGEFSPHEIVEFSRQDGSLEVRQTFPEQYPDSWRRRLLEVGRLLARENGRSLPDDAIRKFARIRLVERGETLLLDSEDSYRPIDAELLYNAYNSTRGLARRLQNVGAEGEPFVVSLSYVGTTKRPVYWDIVWPHLKYAASAPVS